MRKAIVALCALGAAFLTAPAIADGPSGSQEERQACIDDASGAEVPRQSDGACPDGSTDTTVWENNVTCGDGQDAGVGRIYAGANGVEVCNDGSGALPLHGRIIVTSDDGGYVAADGDRDNAPEAQGWARVDGSGLRCGADDGSLDATHPGDGDTADNCG
ncbi:MAG TPA: hypothetical protein VGB52_15235 [Actinomycetota bacterium]|jgi:hypothetical protein